jgi:hypothetical protein
LCLAAVPAVAQKPPDAVSESPAARENGVPGAGSLNKDAEPPPDLPDPTAGEVRQRTQLNLLGRTDTAGGESRRNENVQFNLVDNNALKELNVRLGISATIIDRFEPERRYFGAEFGNPPTAPVHTAFPAGSGVHGSVFLRHQNSAVSARSFFQVGDVQPARENSYGFSFNAPTWRGAYFLVDGSQKRSRGNVNGNVLVPRPDERTPIRRRARSWSAFFPPTPNSFPTAPTSTRGRSTPTRCRKLMTTASIRASSRRSATGTNCSCAMT